MEERWRGLRERIAVRDRSGIRDLVEAAFAEPRLRVLSPGRPRARPRRSPSWSPHCRRTRPTPLPDPAPPARIPTAGAGGSPGGTAPPRPGCRRRP
ncbi:DUF6193 family natural product biosynthesis protein [Streptomyces sp. NPDC056883]|uniref:DUF6193 family natural product biosynthesis protein n=1 Tax=Streptomyces sp. NPDC056883 TaxID=3345959 RepID=UPI0036AC17FD